VNQFRLSVNWEDEVVFLDQSFQYFAREWFTVKLQIGVHVELWLCCVLDDLEGGEVDLEKGSLFMWARLKRRPEWIKQDESIDVDIMRINDQRQLFVNHEVCLVEDLVVLVDRFPVDATVVYVRELEVGIAPDILESVEEELVWLLDQKVVFCQSTRVVVLEVVEAGQRELEEFVGVF